MIQTQKCIKNCSIIDFNNKLCILNFQDIILLTKESYIYGCLNYYYINKTENISYCTNTLNCTEYYDKLIEEKRECVSDCSKDDIYRFEFRKKCYKECPINSIERYNNKEINGFSLDYKYFCKPICDEEYPFEMIQTQKCIKNCPIKYISDNLCIINIQKEYNNDNKKSYDILLKKFEIEFTSSNYNTSNLEKGENEVILHDQMTITLSTTDNQKSNINNTKTTTVDLNECEDVLRNVYNIPNNEKLFMKKIDIEQKGMNIPKISYEVYSILNGSNLVKLNLSFCENIKVDISIPLTLTEDIDKLNSSSRYYNDLCYTTTSDIGTDLTLNDRKNEFIEKNKTVCQEKCIFSYYDYNLQKAICSCNLEDSSPSDYLVINKTLLYDNFLDVNNIANINILVCYKVLFTSQGIIYNYGFYLISLIIIFHLVFIIIFYTRNLFSKIKIIITAIAIGINNDEINTTEEKKCNTVEKLVKRIRRNKKLKKKLKIKESMMETNYNKKTKKIIQMNKIDYIKNEGGAKKNPPIKKNITICDNFKKDKNNLNTKNPKDKSKKIPKNQSISKINSTININNLEIVKNVMAYTDEELNDLKYKSAMKFDKRTFCQYYFSLLKINHDIIFTFFNNSDYNSKIIKIDLFLLNFVLNLTINILFFNDDTMHKIYEDQGSFNFIYQLPQILYSTLISKVIYFVVKIFALTGDLILDFKKIKNKNNKKNIKGKMIALVNKLKLEILLYFLINSIFLLLFWYYVSMFCAIYANTQIHLIKDTIISYGLSLIYPFGIYLIPGLLRIFSLSKPKRKTFYKISYYLQKFC